jgi:uncharacterized protein
LNLEDSIRSRTRRVYWRRCECRALGVAWDAEDLAREGAPAVATAGRAVDHGAEVARFVVCTLARNVEMLRPGIPASLTIDTFNGAAWIGVVPFSMTGVRLRGTPALPWVSAFPELNVRTYVTAEEKPGVWFFSLDGATARAWFHLPYFGARMSCEQNEKWTAYCSERTHRGAPEAGLVAKYRPLGGVFSPQNGTLEYFLTERYGLYAADSRGPLFRGEIHHPGWSLQAAEAHFPRNTMAEAAGVRLPSKQPLLHFAQRQDMVAWAPRRIA